MCILAVSGHLPSNDNLLIIVTIFLQFSKDDMKKVFEEVHNKIPGMLCTFTLHARCTDERFMVAQFSNIDVENMQSLVIEAESKFIGSQLANQLNCSSKLGIRIELRRPKTFK